MNAVVAPDAEGLFVVAPDAEGLLSVPGSLSLLLKLRAALASQLPWSATVISWHMLFSFPLHHPSSLQRKAYKELITATSQKPKTLSQRHHKSPKMISQGYHDSLVSSAISSLNTRLARISSASMVIKSVFEILPPLAKRRLAWRSRARSSALRTLRALAKRG